MFMARLLGLCILMLTTAAQAGLVYTYTGQPLIDVVGDTALIPSGSNILTATVTFGPGITAGFTGDVDETSVLSASISIFGVNLDLADSTSPEMAFSFANGAITAWGFASVDDYTPGGRNLLVSTTSNNDTYAHYAGPGQEIDLATFSESPGSWTLRQTPIPEPTSLLILTASLTLLAHRRRHIPAGGGAKGSK